MKKYSSKYSFCLLILLLLSSCAPKEREPQTSKEVPKGMKAIDFCFSIANATEKKEMRATDTGKLQPRSSWGSSLLRAVEDGDRDQEAYTPNQLNENKIERIDIFLIRETSSFFKHFPDTSVERLSIPSSGNNTYKVRVLIPYSDLSAYQGNDFKIIVVANAKETLFSSGVNSLEDLKRKIQEDELNLLEGGVTPKAQPCFLMDGIGTTGTVLFSENLYTVTAPISLYRAAAKIRLRMPQELVIFDHQNGKKTQYHLQGNLQVKLVSYTNKTSLLRDNPYQVQDGEWKSTPYREMTLKTLPAREGSSNTSFLAAFPFYAYESLWNESGNIREAHLIVKAKLRPEGANASDQGRDYFYRIPLNYAKPITGVDAKKLHRIERNHLYDILSNIEVLGSLSENEPVDISSYAAVQPWNTPDRVDGALTEAHYLLVREKMPRILNVADYSIDYASDMPVRVEIQEVYYEYYESDGTYKKIEEDYNRTIIVPTEPHTGGKINIHHEVPKNYLPLYITFKVKQIGGLLEETVRAVQYPHRYLTYEKSPGLSGGKSFDEWGREIFADFRYHTGFGSIPDALGVQKNDILTKITTLVPEPGEKIGKPLDPSAPGNTSTDAAAGELISPEFMMATQYGVSASVPQYQSFGLEGWATPSLTYEAGYGPTSKRFKPESPYYSYWYGHIYERRQQSLYRNYSSAGERAKRYFEGEYGANGVYVEHYRTAERYADGSVVYVDGRTRAVNASRTIRKKFANDGHWRIPTAAELRVVAKIQADPNTPVKDLLRGQIYWCAETGYGVYVQDPDKIYPKRTPYSNTTNVRLVFDTWQFSEE